MRTFLLRHKVILHYTSSRLGVSPQKEGEVLCACQEQQRESQLSVVLYMSSRSDRRVSLHWDHNEQISLHQNR